MEQSTRTILRIGDWRVDPVTGEIARNGEAARLELRTLRLLLCLAEHAGQTVSIEELLAQVWPEVTVSSDSVYQGIATLRRQLGDDPRNPTYIATVPRLGYRMLAKVSPWTDQSADAPATAQAARPTGRQARRSGILLWAGGAAILLLLAGAFVVYHRLENLHGKSANADAPAQPEKSMAVLPFLDLTEGMRNEEFADGMTEELIDKLSKVPGLRVPSATASFYFKNKRVALGEIAKNLGVIYVMDGSVRKSGARLRIAARLVRADNGYVIWSETYDRPVGDLVAVQDDIAGDVARALAQSINGQP